VAGVLGQVEVDGGVVHGHLQVRLLVDVGDGPPLVVEAATVRQAGPVLLRGS
jgi:hypothetical protein